VAYLKRGVHGEQGRAHIQRLHAVDGRQLGNGAAAAGRNRTASATRTDTIPLICPSGRRAVFPAARREQTKPTGEASRAGRKRSVRRVWAAVQQAKRAENAGAVFCPFGQGARTLPCLPPT
jgi:hypothetical protein